MLLRTLSVSATSDRVIARDRNGIGIFYISDQGTYICIFLVQLHRGPYEADHWVPRYKLFSSGHQSSSVFVLPQLAHQFSQCRASTPIFSPTARNHFVGTRSVAGIFSNFGMMPEFPAKSHLLPTRLPHLPVYRSYFCI